VDINTVNKILDFYPIHAIGNPLSVCLLDEIEPEHSYGSFKSRLDSIFLMPNKRYVILEARDNSPFPLVSLDGKITPSDINGILYDRYEIFRKVLILQSQIAGKIIEQACKFEVIVFIIVDGLSYFDCKERFDVIPCLVDGISKTENGYKNCVGNPTIGRQLFACGFKNLIGFSYWTREMDTTGLTDKLFVPFSQERMIRVRSFKEVSNLLSNQPLLKTYVQIVMQGLDQLGHDYRDEPMIKQTVDIIFNRFEKLKDIILKKKLRALVCMTSDHGILWRENNELQLINEPSQSLNHSPRYLDGKIMRDYVMPVTSWGNNYSLLKYPFITRKLRNNEWGIHGGLSAEESIIPLVMEVVE
jgi:hypothetical protein